MKKMRIAAALMAVLMVTGCGSSQPSSQPQMNVGIDYNDSLQPETEANSTQSEEAVNDEYRSLVCIRRRSSLFTKEWIH